MNNILFTGGTGKLGRELIPLLEGRIINPDSVSMDLRDKDKVEFYVKKYNPDILVHSAAYTNLLNAELYKTQCWNTNVIGSLNLVKSLLRATMFVYISTDYVFDGETGNYTENDIPNPINFYSKTKLIAENIIKTCKNFLIIRTSFCSNIWPYSSAFKDVLTNQDYVGNISILLALVINNIEYVNHNSILNIGTKAKSMYDLALKTNPNVKAISYKESKVPVPQNTTMNLSEFKKILERILKNCSNPELIQLIDKVKNSL
jgi:dTDP-4-dehydrorhamnose reductase